MDFRAVLVMKGGLSCRLGGISTVAGGPCTLGSGGVAKQEVAVLVGTATAQLPEPPPPRVMKRHRESNKRLTLKVSDKAMQDIALGISLWRGRGRLGLGDEDFSGEPGASLSSGADVGYAGMLCTVLAGVNRLAANERASVGGA
jgi:hypothetical protein